jgi:hypothetical protein
MSTENIRALYTGYLANNNLAAARDLAERYPDELPFSAWNDAERNRNFDAYLAEIGEAVAAQATAQGKLSRDYDKRISVISKATEALEKMTAEIEKTNQVRKIWGKLGE